MKSLNLHKIPELNKIDVCKDVKLCPLRQSDSLRILEILEADNNIRNKVTVASRLYTLKDIEEEIERFSKDVNLIRYSLLKENNPIGLISFWRDEGFLDGLLKPNDYGFGYFLDPNERGKGLITRSLQSLMNVVVKNIRVNQFVAFCEDNNYESITILTKLGFKPTEKKFIEPDNGWVERKYIKK
jgi:RimJ/RimL family protein N-acetyltransferase